MDLELRTLTLINFKNIEQAQIDFNGKINCLVGPNGAGKTNILDAIHYLSFTKSYFNITDSQAIRFGQDFFSITGNFTRLDNNEQISIIYKKDTKIVKANGKKYKKLSRHIGRFPAVIITPEDTKLITGSGEDRRKFLDIIISQADPQYLAHLSEYKKILQQRNSLIKTFAREKYVDNEMLELWDEQLSNAAQYIHRQRKQFIEQFKPLLREYYRKIANNDEQADIEYKSHLNSEDLMTILRNNLQKDLALEYTYAGIHRDDLDFKLNGQPIRKFGSQGQQKSFLLALKFAQHDFIKQQLKIKPLLLLDDIFDKLDPNRVEKLVHLVADNQFGQIFITHTNPQRLEQILQKVDTQYQIFHVRNGQILENPPL